MKNFKLIFSVLVTLILVGLLYVFLAKPAVAPALEEEMVMCTMDARQCPDGSYVGRSGPNCEFVCPEVAEVEANLDI